MSNSKKVILLFSGGLDSTTLLYHLLSQVAQVSCLSFYYGQRHRRELEAASAICGSLGIPFRITDISGAQALLASGALTGETTVPDGHYTDISMKQTIVPNRNMIFLALATGAAITNACSAVAYAAHSGDHFIYPDCRPEFVTAMQAAIALCDDNPPQLETPFLNLTKGEIVARGAELKVPFAETWSCYKGGESHCGTCGTCVERKLAFSEAKVADPTRYITS